MVALVVESWIWYGCVMLVAASRYISRYMTLGSLKRFQLDDYGMLIVLCFYTTLVVTINIVRNTNSNLLPPGFNVATISPSDKAERVFGSKLILVVEQSQCVTIWGAKLCLLVLYLRLTQMRWQNIGIKVLIGYVIGSFIIMDILYFAVWCRPFYEYWAVPTNSRQCDAATNHLITNAVFNLSSDLILLAIGLPMFLRMKLPWNKKGPLIVIFSLGIFVIIAAILNKVYSFSQPYGSLWTYWYVRESSTALLVANLPFVWRFWAKVTRLETITRGTWKETTTAEKDDSLEKKASTKGLPDLPDDTPSDSQRRSSNASNEMTFEEMLRSGGPPEVVGRRKKRKNNGPPPLPPLPPMDAFNDSQAQHRIHREHSNNERPPVITPTSSVPRSADKSWSASSFV